MGLRSRGGVEFFAAGVWRGPLNTKQNFEAALRFSTLTHELGHALGVVGHNPAPASVMSCGSPPYAGDYLFFAAQDRANLLAVYNPAAVGIIEGKINQPGYHYVFAVDVERGVTWAALSEKAGHFEIPIGRAGSYRVFAKGYESSHGKKPLNVIPSWYVKDGVATNDPEGGKALAVQLGQRVAGIELALLRQPSPFNLFHTMTYTKGDPADDMHSFLEPGKALRLALFPAGGKIASLRAYGRRPDCQFQYQSTNPQSGAHFLQVSARAGAHPGHRLLIAKSADGVVQAGLVGIHVIGSRYPDRLAGKPSSQLAQGASASKVDPDFWKQ